MHNSSENGVSCDKEAVKRFADELHQHVKQSLNYKRLGMNIRGDTIRIHTSRVSLYFRFKPTYYDWPKQTFVISSIWFKESHRGKGSALLAFLADVSGRYDYRHIAVESAGKDESIQGFLRKFKFLPHDAVHGHWIVPVSDLKAILDSEPMSQAA